eukprot:1287850-Rhodomonas_salina.1
MARREEPLSGVAEPGGRGERGRRPRSESSQLSERRGEVGRARENAGERGASAAVSGLRREGGQREGGDRG